MISIVVPVYNAEKYLKKSIESILCQTYPAWELILVDNGSEDRSYQVCREYAMKEERIQVLHQHQNRGVSVARNLGLEKAGGDFITFLDADDWVTPDYLETLIRLQKETHAEMLVCQYEKVYEADREREQNLQEVTQKKHTVKEYYVADYIEQCLLEGYTHCWGVLYKTPLLEALRFPNKISIGEDMLFLIEAVLQADKIAVTDYVGYQYFINENGAMNRKFTSSYMDQIVCWQQAMEKLLPKYPAVEHKLESILVVSAMLIVGKISALDKKEQEEYHRELMTCHEIVREYGRKKQVYKLLPAGYPVKVKLFDYIPEVYLNLYKIWKK